MAVTDDRGPLTGRAGPARTTWLAVIGSGLALALLAVALVQGRQATLLSEAVQSDDDYAVLMVYQAETEYLRLRERLAFEQADAPDPAALEALRLRHDIFASRIALLHAERIQRLLWGAEDFRGTLAAIDAYFEHAEPVFGAEPRMPATKQTLAPLRAELAALGVPIHSLSLAAAHHVSAQAAERNRTVRRHNHIGIGLTVFLSALTLAFAVIALGQMRRLEQRRSALEELAGRLRAARRDAELASEAKSVFLANMSHEIRTPFHGLLGMLSLLRGTGLEPRQLEYVRTATESADHLLAILNDILDLSQLESGRMRLVPVPVELRALLADVEALMRPQAAAKRLALHVGVDDSVPLRVLADPTRVKQVLFNLLSNAIKFSDQGTVTLAARSRPGGQQERELEFVVADSGVGMDEATLARLFRRFEQGDASPSLRHGGAGLGLEISRNLARLMGGDLTAHSRPGHGSRFTFTMPQLEVTGPTAAPAAPAAALAAAAALPAQRLAVLVAEDHPVNRRYMAALLENLGHDSAFAVDGAEAVDALRKRRFDLVLMDLQMPVLDGVGATRAIRSLADRAAATVPIVALTADADPETRDRCTVAGMNDYLTKPVGPEKLAALLRRLFGAGAGAAADAAASRTAPNFAGDAGSALVDAGAIAAALQAMPREQLAALIHGFLDDGESTAARLRCAVRDARTAELRVDAHAARGAALNLGLPALAATAEALHDGAAKLPAHEIARLVQRFADLQVETRRAVEAAGLPRRQAAAPAVTR